MEQSQRVDLVSSLVAPGESTGGFKGTLDGVSLPDMLQLYHQNRRSLIVEVDYADGEHLGEMRLARIHLLAGEIVHLEVDGSKDGGTMDGGGVWPPSEQVQVEQLALILTSPSGSVKTLPPTECPRTIRSPFVALMIDAMRRFDERRRGGQAALEHDGTRDLPFDLDDPFPGNSGAGLPRDGLPRADDFPRVDDFPRADGLSGFTSTSPMGISGGYLIGSSYSGLAAVSTSTASTQTGSRRSRSASTGSISLVPRRMLHGGSQGLKGMGSWSGSSPYDPSLITPGVASEQTRWLSVLLGVVLAFAIVAGGLMVLWALYRPDRAGGNWKPALASGVAQPDVLVTSPPPSAGVSSAAASAAIVARSGAEDDERGQAATQGPVQRAVTVKTMPEGLALIEAEGGRLLGYSPLTLIRDAGEVVRVRALASGTLSAPLEVPAGVAQSVFDLRSWRRRVSARMRGAGATRHAGLHRAAEGVASPEPRERGSANPGLAGSSTRPQARDSLDGQGPAIHLVDEDDQPMLGIIDD